MQVVDSEGYLKVKLVGGPVGPFVPYTGATANVNLGEYEIKAGQFTLDTSPTGTAVVGTTRWNDSIGSSETTLKGGSVILKNGVDLVARVVNKVTPNATLTKANYTAVRISGAQGQRLAVAYAQANNDANSADTIGLVTETIPTNQEGFIITVGNLEGVNTTGALQGETWSDGDVLYLSPTTPGAITNIKPTGLTGHIIVIGYVEYAHAINGKIYVKIMNGWELDELHNVYINPATLANNNILQYDSADQLWKNKVLSTGITIGSTAIASGTVGRILFEGAGNVVQESSSLFWDNTNLIFTLGSTATRIFNFRPEDTTGTYGNSCSIRGGNGNGRLDFYSASNITEVRDNVIMLTSVSGPAIQVASYINLNLGGSTRLQVASTTGNVLIGTTTDAGFRLDVNGTARVSASAQNVFQISGTNAVATRIDINHATNTGFQLSLNSVRKWSIASYGAGDFTFYNDALTADALFIKGTTNNVIIGGNSDAGFKLDVNGTARVQGNAQFGTGFYWDNTNGRLGIGTSSPSTTLHVVGQATISTSLSISGGFVMTEAGNVHNFTAPATNRTIRFITNSQSFSLFPTGNFAIGTTTDAGFKLDVNGTARVQGATTFNNSLTNTSGGFSHSSASPSNDAFFTLLSSNIRFYVRANGYCKMTTSIVTDANGLGSVDASAISQIDSTTKGFLPPRMTTTQKNAIATPATGLQVYDTTLNRPCFYDGTTWITL